MGNCIFCAGGRSNEHIIAQWLIRDAELDKHPLKIGFGAAQGGRYELVDDDLKIRKFLTTSVCETCNNGWMSRLENTAKQALTPLLQPNWPVLDIEPLEALLPFCRDLTLWMLKTAVTFGEKMSVRIPNYIKQDLPKGIIRPAVVLDLACSELSCPFLRMTNQWTVVVDGQQDVRQNPDSFRLTWQIRHLVLRVSYFPYTERLQLNPRYPVVLYPYPVFRIPPNYDDRRPSGLWVRKKRYVYSNVKQFEDETTYQKTCCLDPVRDAWLNPLYKPW